MCWSAAACRRTVLVLPFSAHPESFALLTSLNNPCFSFSFFTPCTCTPRPESECECQEGCVCVGGGLLCSAGLCSDQVLMQWCCVELWFGSCMQLKCKEMILSRSRLVWVCLCVWLFCLPSRSLLCLCNPCQGAQIVIMLVATSSEVLVINVSPLQVRNFRPQAIIWGGSMASSVRTVWLPLQ